jgi:putative phosphoesterase
MILSDTHGKLPLEVLRACEGADHIVHAGDVGNEAFLHELATIAPVTAVCGNVDPPDLAPLRARLELGSWRILIQHIVWDRGGPSSEVQRVLADEPADLVVFGHSHQPLCKLLGEGVFFNPGSCGPKRFSLPTSYGEARLSSKEGWFQHFDLEGNSGGSPVVLDSFEFAHPRGADHSP